MESNHLKEGLINHALVFISGIPLSVEHPAIRISLLPGVQIFVESGVKDFVSFLWYGTPGPAGLPKNVTAGLNHSINKALESTEVKQRFTAMTSEINDGSPEDFSQSLVSGDLRWKDVLRQVKVQLD